MVILLFQHTILVWKFIIHHRKGWFQSGVFSHSWSGVSTFGSTGCGSVDIPMYQSVSLLLHLGKSTTLELNTFNYPWTYQVSFTFPTSTLVPLILSKSLVEHVTGQFRLLILDALCWMEVSWLPTFLSMLEDIPHWFNAVKDLGMDVLVGQMLKGMLSLHVILWLLRDVCCADNGSLP